MKEEKVSKLMTTTDIAIEESIPLGQEGSEDAKNEATPVQAPSDEDGGSASNIHDESASDDDTSSYDTSFSSISSSSSNESSVFSSPDMYASDFWE